MALTTVSQHQIALTILLFTFLVAIKANPFCKIFLIAAAPVPRFASNPLVTSILTLPALSRIQIMSLETWQELANMRM